MILLTGFRVFIETITKHKILEYVKPAKPDIGLTIYPNAHHSFDSIEPIEFIPNAIKLKEEFAVINEIGNLTFTTDNNEVINIDEKEGRIKLLQETSDILGAHAGGNWEARRQSHVDVVSFFKKQFLS